MASTQNGTTPLLNGSNGQSHNFTVKAGLAQMLKGGVIMDVVNVEQVKHGPALQRYLVTDMTSSTGPYCRRSRRCSCHGP